MVHAKCKANERAFKMVRSVNVQTLILVRNCRSVWKLASKVFSGVFFILIALT